MDSRAFRLSDHRVQKQLSEDPDPKIVQLVQADHPVPMLSPYI